MDDLKKLSVERLRELARKHLGKGHSRLRTKAQLLEALRSALRELVPRAASKVRVVDFPPGRKGRVRSERAASDAAGAPDASGGESGPAGAAKAGSGQRRQAPASGPSAVSAATGRESGATGAAKAGSGQRRQDAGSRPSAVSAATGRGRAPASVPPPVVSPAQTRPAKARAAAGDGRPPSNGAPDASGSTRAAPPPAPVEAPVEEGFFEAQTTPRRPRRTPAHLEPFEPGPFASPREVGTDAPLLLVRDPTTLFVFWDFRRELERGAALGLREPRLLLRLFRAADLDRTLELPLTSRSTYVTGLSSGQEYTAEVLLLGRDGWTRPVGSRSLPRRLPPGRVSAQLEVRMLRLPWSEPLSEAPAPSAASAPRQEPLDSPRRVPLPTSPGARPGDRSGPSGGSRSGQN